MTPLWYAVDFDGVVRQTGAPPIGHLFSHPTLPPPHSREGSGSTPPPLWGRLGGGEQLRKK
ncbi:MAG: hypothetical protein KJZ86_25965 [Caldilineaceae bacterium]|nr:hypothetical protein [Caldilineaceae bacterium]